MEDRLGLKKRKRRGPGLEDLNLVGVEDRKNRVDQLTDEMEGLFRYFAEVTVPLDAPLPTKLEGAVRVLMEGSHLPLSELVALILQRVAAAETPSEALVKTAVLSVGRRVCYGLANPDADLLEDTSRNALWCWEAADVKLLPKPVRALVRVHRTCRKKIHDRVAALSALIDALLKLEGDPRFENDVVRASDKLGKVLAEADIRLLVTDMLQRLTTPSSSDNTMVQGDKLLTKELDKSIKQVEREKKRTEMELQKERRQNEKEQKLLQDEAEKDEKRREKEESEMRKLVRKKQEEAEREQRRQEKEAAELKKKLAVKKQASLMERFLKKSKVESPCQNSNKATTPDLLPNPNGDMPSAATQSMDYSLSSRDDIESIDGIRKSHLTSWHHHGRSNREQHWSIRRKPKVELIKEIKLKAAKESPWDDELAAENLVSGWGGQNSYERTNIDGGDTSSPGVKVCKRKLQLLQFDKSNRPAFYGIWPNKSSVVGPRHPLRKDPDLDYDVDSDEEWEEEDPGESISDCDEDEEEESLDQGCSKAAEDEDEDDFFVPDGYLSENEGVQVDRVEIDAATSEIRELPSFEDDEKSEEFRALLSQQKYLNNLTESALRKNKPLIILNLVHEKLPLLASEGLTGTLKLEKLCLQALSIRAFPGEPLLPIAVCNNQAEDQDVSVCNSSCHTPPDSTSIIIQDLDMRTFVSSIQSCSHSMHKMVESLQQKFPATSKTQLKRKVREISKYVDNRWQVKKEILEEVGLPAGTGTPSPDKGGLVSSFFKKRCLPAVDKSGNLEADYPAPKSSDADIAQQQER